MLERAWVADSLLKRVTMTVDWYAGSWWLRKRERRKGGGDKRRRVRERDTRHTRHTGGRQKGAELGRVGLESS